MRILVTGAAGLIGSGVAARLREDHDVIGLDLVPARKSRIVADCLDVAEWGQAVGAIDAIVHVAALHAPHVGQRSDAEFRRANVEATARLLDFALSAGASHFVLTSTTSLYGHALEPDRGRLDRRAGRAAAARHLRRNQAGGGAAGRVGRRRR